MELAESVSSAMLTVLAPLTPVERAVLVLREVFDVPCEEIAEAVGKSAAAARRIIGRARSHVAVRRRCLRVDRRQQQEVLERFLAAVTTGDVQGLMDVLAPDVVLIAEGGGVAQAVRVPVYGAKNVTDLLLSFPESALNPRIALLWLNGGLGIRIDDEAGGPSLISLVVEDGRIARIFAMRNLDALGHLGEETLLAR